MGLVLDSSVLIVAEREAKPVSSLLVELQQQHGENEIVLRIPTINPTPVVWSLRARGFTARETWRG